MIDMQVLEGTLPQDLEAGRRVPKCWQRVQRDSGASDARLVPCARARNYPHSGDQESQGACDVGISLCTLNWNMHEQYLEENLAAARITLSPASKATRCFCQHFESPQGERGAQ